jgi:hypothetical protein
MMTKTLSFGSLLLLSSALTAPAALAQSDAGTAAPSSQATTPPSATDTQAGTPAPDAAQDEQENIQVSAPGINSAQEQEIVVVGRNVPNILRATPEVISVLSNEDIARTGEGDIAGALQRVTGLSVVGNGFVFVRGLGDRYSLALLNGSPLPSPEPLRRVVPLDIFPTGVIASALVQKTYSVAYPGEFGGGVINLTTITSPRDPFLTLGASVGYDSETTGQLGYTYYGSDLDILGFDDGTRDFPGPLRSAVQGGTFNFATTPAQRRDLAASLANAETTLLQRNGNLPANFSAEVSGGTSFDVAGGRIGLVAAAGFNNSWRSRDTIQQTSLDPNLAGTPQTDSER